MERMNASLGYYKGFDLRHNYPFIDRWLTLFENFSAYRGTQGDFHTHSHDLPPVSYTHLTLPTTPYV